MSDAVAATAPVVSDVSDGSHQHAGTTGAHHHHHHTHAHPSGPLTGTAPALVGVASKSSEWPIPYPTPRGCGLWLVNDNDYEVWYTIYYDGASGSRAQKESGSLGKRKVLDSTMGYATGSSYYIRCEVKDGGGGTIADTIARFTCGSMFDPAVKFLKFEPSNNSAWID